MKVLVISDIHANIRALDTILREEADYDLLCCAGDFTDYGISPREVLERFRQLENTVLVYGNHDRHVINIYESGEWTNVADGKYKWVHYNCERLSEKDIDWMKQLPEKAYFEADGWSYGIAHQYDNGYGTVESRYAFDQYWNASYGAECDGKRRLIFGHTQRRKVKDFFIKFKKKSHFADFLTEQTLDFVLHRLFCGLAEMDTDDIGCLADLLSDSRASGGVGCGIVHSKSSCK